MPIASDRPESGVRIAIERDAAKDEPPWIYSGNVHLPEGSHPVAVTVDGAGEVTVEIGPGAPADLSEKVRLIVRTVYKQAKAEDEPPAWRIVRWRGPK